MITFKKDGMIKYIDDASSLVRLLELNGWEKENEKDDDSFIEKPAARKTRLKINKES